MLNSFAQAVCPLLQFASRLSLQNLTKLQISQSNEMIAMEVAEIGYIVVNVIGT